MNIVLIGFMGTGKSAVGQEAARRSGRAFRDTDAEIVHRAGRSIPEIFAQDGESAFRAMETETLASLAGENRIVLSTGGGTPLRDENANLLKRIGPVVWLTASPEAILRRVGPNLAARPLLAGHADDPLTRIRSLLTERTPKYRAAADLEIETERFPDAESVAGEILRRLTDIYG